MRSVAIDKAERARSLDFLFGKEMGGGNIKGGGDLPQPFGTNSGVAGLKNSNLLDGPFGRERQTFRRMTSARRRAAVFFPM